MEEDLRAVMLLNGPLTSLVSSRIDWGARPQGSPLPGVVMFVISGNEGEHLKGRDGLFNGRVQIDCYGETYASAKQTGRAVIDLLHGYRDNDFPGVFHVGTRDDRLSGVNEADRPFRQSLDFSVNWKG